MNHELIRRIKTAILNALKPYSVYVQCGEFEGASHKAWTKADALSWMACYPNDCQVFVSTRGFFRRFNNVVMFRQDIR